MSSTDRILSQWDLGLLDRHLWLYEALANGERQPTSASQAHFVVVAHGHARPSTQHEIAFQRFRDGWRDPRRERNVSCLGPAHDTYATIRAECSAHEAALLETDAKAESGFQRVRALCLEGKASARRVSADASAWIAIALAEPRFARYLEHWTSDTFGKLSNVYTQALDGDFVNGLRAGSDYVSPWLHRLYGGHTLNASWQAARDVLPDDSFAEEVVGWLRALGSDFVTVVGLPLVSLTSEQFNELEAFVCDIFGVSWQWLGDMLHENAIEGLDLVTGCVPIVTAVMGWSQSDAESYARVAARLGVGAVVAANPIMALVALAMLARAYQMAKGGDTAGLWRSLVEGGVPAAAALGIASMTGGPPLFGVVAGLIIAKAIKDALKSDPGFGRPEWLEEPANRTASVFTKFMVSGAGFVWPSKRVFDASPSECANVGPR